GCRLLVCLCARAKLYFQPAGDITEGVQTAKLVEYLMPCILVEDDLDVFQPCAAVQVYDAPYAFAIFADRVFIPGKEQQRQAARRMAERMRCVRLGDQCVQIAETGGGQDK